MRSVEHALCRDGLDSSAAAAQLALDGYNELPSAKPRSPWQVALDVLREPMLLLLIAASIVYLVIGDTREALLLFASVFVVIAIAFVQRRKTERALEALRDLASPRAQVMRDGAWQYVPAREVVKGDILRVKEGDRVPADALLVESTDVSVDESMLTGESTPVSKRPALDSPSWQRPGGDNLPFVYSGSLVTRGQGVARVEATGARTEIGRIGKSLQTLVDEPTPMERDIRRAVVIFAGIGTIPLRARDRLVRTAAGKLAGRIAGRYYFGNG
jgi:Ca2+-transporting ATPase